MNQGRQEHSDDIAYPSSIAFLLIHLGMLRRLLDRGDVARRGARRGAVSGAHLRDRRRLPSLLLPSRLPHQPRLSVLPGVPGADLGAARHSVVGRQAPPAPQIFGHRAGCAFAGAARLSLRPCRLDLRAAQQRYRLCDGARPDPVQGAGVARSAALSARRYCSAVASVADRRLARAGRRLLLEHGGAVACDIQHQLARPCGWPTALCHRRSVPEQLAACAADHGRGLAQQSSRVSGVGPPGFPLVGVRSDLLRVARAVVGRDRLGPACSTEGGGPRRT